MNRKTPFVVHALCLVLLAWLTPVNASAFETCTTGGGLDIKWSTPNVPYKVNEAGGPSGSLAALLAGLQTWTDVGSSSFVFTYGGPTTKTFAQHGANDGENIIVFGPMGATGTLAENKYWYLTGSGFILDSDIQFNTSYSWNTTGGAGYYDVQNVGTHEQGHTLCLKDLYNGTLDYDKTMYGYAASGETKKRTLDPDDVAGITYLYPAPNIVLTPANLSFGDVAVGQTSDQTVTVTNNGAADLIVGSIIGPSSPFGIVNDLCSGHTLTPSTGSCTVTARFSPVSAVTSNGNFNVPSNDPDQNPATVGLSGTGIQTNHTLSVNKSGSGSGSVTSLPAGINCGPSCSAVYSEGTTVTLSALSDADSTFTGWSGGGCSGTGTCQVTMNADTNVTAAFDTIPPTADFTASPLSGSVPLAVSFSDLSAHAVSWTWDFGDGESSILQNPTHTYKSEGAFSVSLTASNPGGSDLMTKTGYITVAPCINQPVRLISGSSTTEYTSLQNALTDAVDGDVIDAQALDFSGDLSLDITGGGEITLEGGYGCDYQAIPSPTTINGSLTIVSGTVVAENIEIR
jgi:hypothetical protein